MSSYTSVGTDLPLRSGEPSDLTSTLSRTSSYVCCPSTTLPGGAQDCRRAATLVVSPIAREVVHVRAPHVADQGRPAVDADPEAWRFVAIGSMAAAPVS